MDTQGARDLSGKMLTHRPWLLIVALLLIGVAQLALWRFLLPPKPNRQGLQAGRRQRCHPLQRRQPSRVPPGPQTQRPSRTPALSIVTCAPARVRGQGFGLPVFTADYSGASPSAGSS